MCQIISLTKRNHWADSFLYQYFCDLFKLENRQTHGYGTRPAAIWTVFWGISGDHVLTKGTDDYLLCTWAHTALLHFSSHKANTPLWHAETTTWTWLSRSLQEALHFPGAPHGTQWARNGGSAASEDWMVACLCQTAFPLLQWPQLAQMSAERARFSEGCMRKAHDKTPRARTKNNVLQTWGITIFPETLGIYASFSASDPEAESDLEAQPSPLQNGFWCTPKSHCPYSHLVFHHLCFPEWFSLITTREKSQWSNPTSLVPSVPANNTQGRGYNSTNIVYRKNCKTTTTSHTTDLPSFMYVFYTNQLTLNWKITNFTNLLHTDKYLYKNGTNKQKQQWKKMKETKAKTTINSFTQSEWEHFINVNGIHALDNAPLSMWFTMTRSVI